MHRKKALELVLTGGEISAQEAERQGLVNRVAPPDRLAEEKRRWMETLAGRDLEGLRAAKAFFRDTAEWSTGAAAQYGVTRLANFFASRDKVLTVGLTVRPRGAPASGGPSRASASGRSCARS